MSHTSMYLSLDPLRVKVGEGDLHGYKYKLLSLIIIIIIIIIFFCSSLYGGLDCIAPTSCWCSFVAIGIYQ